MSDLASLDPDDGTLKLSDQAVREEPGRLSELQRAFGREKHDVHGDEIDLRPTFDDLDRVGSDKQERKKPTYDPLTGELVRPLDVKPPPPKAVIPITGPRASPSRRRATPFNGTVASVRNEKDTDIPALWSLPLRLLEPINLIVLFFVAMGALLTCWLTVVRLGFIMLGLMFVAWALTLAHYANCIDDFGPGRQDDLPRPFRQLDIFNDLWSPFTRMFLALAICFGPAWLLFVNSRVPAMIQFAGIGVLLAAGVFLFPAVALILSASGHVRDLRPDRLLGTILTMGWPYLLAVVLGAVAVGATAFGPHALRHALLLMLKSGTNRADLALSVGIMAGSIVSAAYLSHLAAWTLGVLYRRHADEFPWFFDQYERDRAEDKRLKTLSRMEKSRLRRGRHPGEQSPGP